MSFFNRSTKSRGVTLAAACALGLISTTTAMALPPAFASWDRVFYDGFDDTNWTDKWQTYRTPGGTAGNGSGIYATDAVTEANGNLRIEAYSVGNTDYVGSVRTKAKWTFGYMEANIKMEGASGMHTAFWAMPADTNVGALPANGRIHGAEIDIVEHRAKDGNNANISDDYWTADHIGGYGSSTVSSGKLNQNKTDMTGFHKYGVQWNADMYKFFIDDVYVGFTVSDNGANTRISEVNEFMILSSNVGVDWAGTVGNYGAKGTTGSRMVVDYVGFWQNPSAALALVPEPTSLTAIGGAMLFLVRRRHPQQLELT